MDGHDDPALETADAVRRSVLGLGRQLRLMRSAHGVSAAKLGLLRRLERTGGSMTASDLASLERLQPQSLTRLIADLDERGLIRRTQDQIDRRQFLIEITKDGHDLLARDADRQNTWLSESMSKALTPSEREILRVAALLLDQLVEAGVEPPADAASQDTGRERVLQALNLSPWESA
ncbi:MarR family winged helix-turn-helix transcriptional regulator [Mesorhizobium amorphae]|uniref:MarR family transcriptional regulator n=1 Tax=Mesorhizobium amorphae CCNWGS0123 TaxID=1082933 RepID=G6YCE5_9HYPH|nr:MarR family transcriptional regulator [Mesorhizobium amorphae]ANT53535.1 hypothetical protein A6B35_28495 [Mesorhizobium amorphae CCNWGS0123]EHH10624.1 MarR family transcriptional regulator [Mesorhizobium amorphae CCNWGS0123]